MDLGSREDLAGLAAAFLSELPRRADALPGRAHRAAPQATRPRGRGRVRVRARPDPARARAEAEGALGSRLASGSGEARDARLDHLVRGGEADAGTSPAPRRRVPGRTSTRWRARISAKATSSGDRRAGHRVEGALRHRGLVAHLAQRRHQPVAPALERADIDRQPLEVGRARAGGARWGTRSPPASCWRKISSRSAVALGQRRRHGQVADALPGRQQRLAVRVGDDRVRIELGRGVGLAPVEHDPVVRLVAT